MTKCSLCDSDSTYQESFTERAYCLYHAAQVYGDNVIRLAIQRHAATEAASKAAEASKVADEAPNPQQGLVAATEPADTPPAKPEDQWRPLSWCPNVLAKETRVGYDGKTMPQDDNKETQEEFDAKIALGKAFSIIKDVPVFDTSKIKETMAKIKADGSLLERLFPGFNTFTPVVGLEYPQLANSLLVSGCDDSVQNLRRRRRSAKQVNVEALLHNMQLFDKLKPSDTDEPADNKQLLAHLSKLQFGWHNIDVADCAHCQVCYDPCYICGKELPEEPHSEENMRGFGDKPADRPNDIDIEFVTNIDICTHNDGTLEFKTKKRRMFFKDGLMSRIEFEDQTRNTANDNVSTITKPCGRGQTGLDVAADKYCPPELSPGTLFSLIPQFDRNLVCPRCNNEYSITTVMELKDAFAYRWAQGAFYAKCACGYDGEFDVADRPTGENFLKVWKNEEVIVVQDPFTAATMYVWKIPLDYCDKVRHGVQFMIEHTPMEVIEAACDSGLLRLHNDQVHIA